MLDLNVLQQPLKNEASIYSSPKKKSLVNPTRADSESGIFRSLGGDIDSPPTSTGVSKTLLDLPSNSGADSSDLSRDQLTRNYPNNVILFESNQAIDDSHNEHLPSFGSDNVSSSESNKVFDVRHESRDSPEQPCHVDAGEFHQPENEKSVGFYIEKGCREVSSSGSKSDKVLTIEGLQQVPLTSLVAETAEVGSEQKPTSSDSPYPVSILTSKVSPSEKCSKESSCESITSLENDKPENSLEEAADNEAQSKKKSADNLHTSAEDTLPKARTERVSKTKRGIKIPNDKLAKQSSEANRAQLDTPSEQSPRVTQNGDSVQKSAKTSPDKPPRSSPSKPRKSSPLKPLKPVTPNSTDKKESVQKWPVTDNGEKISQEYSPDKSVNGSTVKVIKQKQSRISNKQTSSNGSLCDGKSGGSTNSASILDKDLRPRSGSPNIPPFLFKLASSGKAPADNPYKALDYALQSVKFFERSVDESHCLELVMSLHVLAAVYCRLGQYEEAVAVLERSLILSNMNSNLEHCLASFSGNMQLGDTFALLGRHEASVEAYQAALKVQKQTLGELDPRVGDTCRYLAEAHLQAMQFDEAERVCQHLLKIHSECSSPGSVEEAADRRLMALVCSGKGDYEKALEYLVLASMALISDGQDLEAAYVQTSIGNTYVNVERFDDAVFAYQKALTVFKSVKGEDHVSVAAVYVSLADLYIKTGRKREAKIYCQSALRIYRKHDTDCFANEVASGLADIASIYEALNEPEQALHLLQNVLDIVQYSPGQQSAIAGIEAQMGVLYYLQGKSAEAFVAFKNAVVLLKAATRKRTSFLGILLNQMGLVCVDLYKIVDAAELFEEAKSILEESCGPGHSNTLTVCTNLASTYDALGRLDDAIQLSQHVLKVKEEHFGSEHPEVTDGFVKLKQLQREGSFPRLWKRNRDA